MADDFAADVEARARALSGQRFEPHAYYDPDGDIIEFLTSQEPYHAERVDSLVTVYRGQTTGQIVGSLIKGARRFVDTMLREAPGFRLDIQDGRVRLGHLFTAQLWHGNLQETRVLTYKRLREVAEEAHAEVEFQLSP